MDTRYEEPGYSTWRSGYSQSNAGTGGSEQPEAMSSKKVPTNEIVSPERVGCLIRLSSANSRTMFLQPLVVQKPSQETRRLASGFCSFTAAGAYRTANFSLGGPAIGNRSAIPWALVASLWPLTFGGSFHDLRLRYIIPDPNPHYHLRAPASTRPVTAASPGIPANRPRAAPLRS